MNVAFPSAFLGRDTTSPARDFDVISGKGCPIIFFRTFTESVPSSEVDCSS
jgi:hypothetical protein